MRKTGAIVLCCVVYSLGWSDEAAVIRTLNLTGHAEVTIKEEGTNDLFLGTVGDALEVKEEEGVVTIKDTYWHKKKDHSVTLNSRRLRSLKKLNAADAVTLDMTLNPVEPTFQDLVINLDTSGMVYLMGIFGVNALHHSGSGSSTIYWVDQPGMVNIDVQSGELRLAGEVGQMDLKVSGDSFVDALNLRVRNIWVHGQDQSIVKVYPLEALFASMRGSSLLQSYNKPKVHSTSTREAAGVTYPELQSYSVALKSHSVLVDPVVNESDESLEGGVSEEVDF